MTCVSDATERELKAASRAYERETKRAEATRKRLHAAIIEHRRDGAQVSDIEDIAPYRRGRITAILDAAGLVEKKPKKDAPAQS
jgi:hypothetical protein